MGLDKLYRAERSRDRGEVVLQGEHLRPVDCRYVDSFVLCQGESGSGASLGARDGSGWKSVFVPSLRLMSDRESVSDGSTPLFGVLNHRPCAPKSDGECSEAFV